MTIHYFQTVVSSVTFNKAARISYVFSKLFLIRITYSAWITYELEFRSTWG